MVDNTEARDAVRQLIKRFDFIAAQGVAMAYVLAKKDTQEYGDYWKPPKLRTEARPWWRCSTEERLNSRGEQAIERFKFMQSLEVRFDAEMKDRNKGDENEEPGIGNWG
jgi:hypothetical protein